MLAPAAIDQRLLTSSPTAGGGDDLRRPCPWPRPGRQLVGMQLDTMRPIAHSPGMNAFGSINGYPASDRGGGYPNV